MRNKSLSFLLPTQQPKENRRQRTSGSICNSLLLPKEMEGSTVNSYRDFSQISTDAVLKIVVPPKAKRKGPRGGVQTPFPTRLFEMLEASQKEGLEHIVSWQPHGRSFIVRKPTLFEAKILPR